MTLYVAPIVEGQTETHTVARLFQRIWRELLHSSEPIEILPPSRAQRNSLIDQSGRLLSARIQEAFQKLSQRIRFDALGRGFLLLLLDAEGDCPATLAPSLLTRARNARSDADIACVLAKRMIENWIYAGASTLAGVNGLPSGLPNRDRHEDRSGAKWLDDQLRTVNRKRKYKKSVDAREFIGKMDLRECRLNSSSFDKLCREFETRLTLPPAAAAGPASQS